MKKLLVLLLISIIACVAIIEEPHDYDDVSLEGIGSSFINYVGKLKPVRQNVFGTINRIRKTMNPVVKKAKNTFVNKVGKPIENKLIKPAANIINNKIKKPIESKLIKPAANIINNKIKKPIENKLIKPTATIIDKKIKKPIENNLIKPATKIINNKIEKPIQKRLVKPAIERIKKFLAAHPKIKKITDPVVKEVKKMIKDPKKTVADILKDPKQGEKFVEKAIHTVIDQVKNSHPFKQIKAHVKQLENFMEKNHIPVKEIQKSLKDAPVKVIKQLSQKARNGIYWLKKKGYWEPIKFVAETAGQIGATALCSAYLTPVICEPAIEFVFDVYVDKYLDKL